MTEALKTLFFGRLPLAIARSIRSEPDAWCDTGADNPYMRETYEIRHRNGMTVWVANRWYGITVHVPRCPKWGDVTFLSAFGLSPGHQIVWQAAKGWLRERRLAPSSRAEAFLADAPQ